MGKSMPLSPGLITPMAPQKFGSGAHILPVQSKHTAEGVKCGRDGRHKGGLAVAAQAVLQNARQLGVSVRYMPGGTLWVCEGADDVAQRAEALVYLLALLQPLACGAHDYCEGCRAGAVRDGLHTNSVSRGTLPDIRTLKTRNFQEEVAARFGGQTMISKAPMP